MSIDLNEVYAVLLESVFKAPDSSVDKEDLAQEATGANDELARDIELFCQAFSDFKKTIEMGDVEQQQLSLVVMRARAMGIETVFRNLAKTVEDVVAALNKRKGDEGRF